MREYIFSIIGASLIAAVITLFLPEGKDISKYVKLLVSLAVICVIVNPFENASGGLTISEWFSALIPNVEESAAQDKYYGVLTDIGERELEKRLEDLICEKFSIGADDIEITVEAHEENGTLTLDRVAVGLYRAAVLKDPYEIEEYVSELVGCACETYY